MLFMMRMDHACDVIGIEMYTHTGHRMPELNTDKNTQGNPQETSVNAARDCTPMLPGLADLTSLLEPVFRWLMISPGVMSIHLISQIRRCLRCFVTYISLLVPLLPLLCFTSFICRLVDNAAILLKKYDFLLLLPSSSHLSRSMFTCFSGQSLVLLVLCLL